MLSDSAISGVPEILRRAARQSRFLQRMLDSRPWLPECLADGLGGALGTEAMRAFIAARCGDEARLRATLRQLRAWVLCHLIARDLAGLADLSEVTETMTAFAETAVGHAHDTLRAALASRYGSPRSPAGEEQNLLIIG
ncbi:MAG: bifunctional glutamine synthetase adenylyltransferase/deadenyltransferase, partial [Azoarcus sp.]|nr:bifunctional glutamine synthetase adenylyltransferase/deadenyltransferase [Azoarcus sp.]